MEFKAKSRVDSPCRGLMGFLFGHKFERVEEIDDEGIGELNIEMIPKPAEDAHPDVWVAYYAMVTEVSANSKMDSERYMGHVCQRCGATVLYEDAGELKR